MPNNNKPRWNYLPKKVYVFSSPADYLEVRSRTLGNAWRKARGRAHCPDELELEEVFFDGCASNPDDFS